MKRKDVFAAIENERIRQDAKWGFPQKNSFAEWCSILSEEVGEAALEFNELHFGRQEGTLKLRIELIQIAAVCVSILEHLDRDGGKKLNKELITALNQIHRHFKKQENDYLVSRDEFHARQCHVRAVTLDETIKLLEQYNDPLLTERSVLQYLKKDGKA